MSKGRVFVIVYSVILIVLFCTFCYLISIVNPPPISTLSRNVNGSKNLKHPAQASTNTLTATGKKDQNVLKKYLRELPDVGVAKYGLEKVDAYELSECLNLSTAASEAFYPRNKNVVYVVPPLWPPTTLNTRNVTTLSNEIFNVTIAPRSPVKGHRRSLIDFERQIVNRNEGSLVLKILDDSGRSRIEVKLGPDGSFENKHIREDNRLKNRKHIFSMPIQRNDGEQYEKSYLSKNTVIKIMPNDTVIFEDDPTNVNTENVIENGILKQDKDVNLTTEEFPLNLFTDTQNKTMQMDIEENYVHYFGDNQIKRNSDSTASYVNTEMYSSKVLFKNETTSVISDDKTVN